MQIQKFGIEIRSLGNVKNLYSDVDKVLDNYGAGNGKITFTVQQQALAHSLQKMIDTKSHFDVCTIRNCSSLCNIYISKEHMDVYQTVHCVSWNEMTPEFRQLLIAMVLDDFRIILNPQSEEIIKAE